MSNQYIIYQSANRNPQKIKTAKSLFETLTQCGVASENIKEITVDAPGSEEQTKQIIDLVPANKKRKWPVVFFKSQFIGLEPADIQNFFESSSNSDQPSSSSSTLSSSSTSSSPDQSSSEDTAPTSSKDPACSACSAPLEDDSSEFCPDCSPKPSSSSDDVPVKKRGRPPSANPKPPKPTGPPGKRGRPPSGKVKDTTEKIKRARGRPVSAQPKPERTGPPPRRGRPPIKPRDDTLQDDDDDSEQNNQSTQSKQQSTVKKSYKAPLPKKTVAHPISLSARGRPRAAPPKKLTPQEAFEVEFKGDNPRGVRQCSGCDLYYVKSHACRQRNA